MDESKAPHEVAVAEHVDRLWRAHEALEETVQHILRQMAEIGQRSAAFADDTARLWEAVEIDRGEAARRVHRIDRLEGAFESQWAVLRRLELDLLGLQQQVKLMQQHIRTATAGSAGG